jgi:hypothetical protein
MHGLFEKQALGEKSALHPNRGNPHSRLELAWLIFLSQQVEI